MRKARKILLTVLTVAFVAFCTLFAISCGEKEQSAFKLSATKVSVSVGGEPASVSVLKGGEEYLGPVSWVSGDTVVAQVNHGQIAGLRAGETEVKAYVQYGEKTYVLSCDVEVQSSVSANIIDMYAYSGTGTLDVTLPAGMLASGVKITGVSYGVNADGANATKINPTLVGDYFLENDASSALTPGTYYLFYDAAIDDVTETLVRRLYIRGIDRYEDLFLLAPFANVNETVYGFSQGMNWWGNSGRLDANPGEYVRYSDSAINVATGMNETREELIDSLKSSSYDGYLDPEKQIAGYDTVYRMYSEKYNKTATPRPFFFFNLFNSANPAWNALDELPDDATISIWARTWFKGEEDETYSHRTSNWMYFFKNMNGGIEQIPAGESAPAAYDKVGGWSNYRISIAKIREELSGANNLAFAIQVDGSERGSFYFELYSVELMATNDIMASTNNADVSLPGLYSGYFDSYDWSIDAIDDNNAFEATGTHANTNVSVPSGEYKVTYIPKLGSKTLPIVERVLYSGLVTNFTKASDVSKGAWSRSTSVRALVGSDIPQVVGVPTEADGYHGFLGNSAEQSMVAIDKFSSNGTELARVDVNWNIRQILSIVLEDMNKPESQRSLKDSDYIAIWTYIPAVKEEMSVRFYLAEGVVHNSSDQYTVGGGVINCLMKADGWFPIKLTVADMKAAIAKKPTTQIQQNVSGKPSMKEVAIKYDTLGLEIHCDNGEYSRLPEDKKDVYFYSVEFGRSLNTAKSNLLDGVSIAYTDDVWTKATFNGVVKNALTGEILVENQDYELKSGKFVSFLFGEFVLEYEVEKDGYSYGLAERNVVLEKDANSPMGYNVISDLISSKDMFYHISEKWGESAITNNAGMIKYGNMKRISDADYDALVKAGYRGSLDKKAVWNVKNVQPVCTNLGGYHNGYRTVIQAGSAIFNDELIDLFDNSNVDLSSAYISVWMRASSEVDFKETYVVPYKKGGGIYDMQHMGGGTGLRSTVSQTGMVAANTWVEHRFYINDLKAKVGDKGLKGLGFQFTITNDYAKATIDSKGTIVENVDIYSIELCFKDVSAYTFATETKIGLPSLGVPNFTQNITIYNDKGVKLTQGTDYTLTSDYALKNLAAGNYTIEYVVSGDTIEQTKFSRKLSVTNQVAEMNTTNVKWWGWHSAGYQSSMKTLDAKPDGYNGKKTTLEYVSGTGGTLNNNEMYMVRVGVDISGLLSNLSALGDDQYLSVWVRVKATGAFTLDHNSIFLDDNQNGSDGAASIALMSNFLTAEKATNGTWMNLQFTKANLNKIGVENMKYLCFQVYNKATAAFSIDFFAVEVLSHEHTGVIALNPANIVSAGWHGTNVSSSAACQNQSIEKVTVPTAAEGYKGSRTADWALHCSGTDANNAFALDISEFLKDIDNRMDNNDYVSIWIRHEGTSWGLFSAKVHLKNANSRDGAYATAATTMVNDYRPSTTATDAINKWIEIRLTKEQLKSAYTSTDKKWLMFEFNIGGGSAACHTYLYDIAVVKQ